MLLVNSFLGIARQATEYRGRKRSRASRQWPCRPRVEPLEVRLVLFDHSWSHGACILNCTDYWSREQNWSNGSPQGDPDPAGAVIVFPQDAGSSWDLNEDDIPGELPVKSWFFHRGGFESTSFGNSVLLSQDIYTDLAGTNQVDIPIRFTSDPSNFEHHIQVNDNGELDLTQDLTSGVDTLLDKTGTGTLVLFGNNQQYVGRIALQQGTLRLYAANALANGTTITALATGTVLDLNNFDLTAKFQTSTSVLGIIRLGSGTLSFSSRSNADIEGMINGSGGLTVAASDARVILGAFGTFTYTGPTLVNGILEVDGTLTSSPITVRSGATLSGSGTVGDVRFEASSSFAVQVGGSAPLNVMGTMALVPGTALAATGGANSVEGQTYTIIHAAGGLTGTFDGLPDNAIFTIGSARFQIHYTANDVQLTHLPQFQPPIFTMVGRPGGSVGGMVSGDFDGDGIPDLAVINEGRVAILHGNGDGTFTRLADLTVPQSPRTLAVGHFHDPNIFDIAVATDPRNVDDHVYVFLGNGDGTFQAPVAYVVGRTPTSIAVEDVNGDGTQDLVVLAAGENGNGTGVSVLLGNSDGTFQDAVTRALQVGWTPSAVALANLGVFGHLDLVVWGVSGPGPLLLVLPGHGDGTFGDPIFTYQFNYPESSSGGLAVGDFNNDGLFDVLVISNSIGSASAYVFVGNGDGTFRPPIRSYVGHQATVLAVGHFDIDNTWDIAVNTTEGLSVLYGRGDGSFGPQNNYNVTGSITIVADDFNHDGSTDLAALGLTSGNVGVLLNAAPGGGPSPRPGRRPTRQARTLADAALAQFLKPVGSHPAVTAASLASTELISTPMGPRAPGIPATAVDSLFAGARDEAAAPVIAQPVVSHEAWLASRGQACINDVDFLTEVLPTLPWAPI